MTHPISPKIVVSFDKDNRPLVSIDSSEPRPARRITLEPCPTDLVPTMHRVEITWPDDTLTIITAPMQIGPPKDDPHAEAWLPGWMWDRATIRDVYGTDITDDESDL